MRRQPGVVARRQASDSNPNVSVAKAGSIAGLFLLKTSSSFAEVLHMATARDIKPPSDRGFTLIELMLVVTIISIVTTISLPTYQDYVSRSRWSDNLVQVSAIKQALGECINSNRGQVVVGTCDTIPNLIAAQFLSANFVTPSGATSKYLGVAPLTVTNGVITLTGSRLASNCVVTLTPTVTPGQTAISWNATTNPLPAGCNRSKTGIGL